VGLPPRYPQVKRQKYHHKNYDRLKGLLNTPRTHNLFTSRYVYAQTVQPRSVKFLQDDLSHPGSSTHKGVVRDMDTPPCYGFINGLQA